MPSESFLRRSPHCREAEWKSRDPREKRPEPGSNQDVFDLMNERGLSRDEAEYAAADLRARGTRTGFGGKGVEPNRNLSPRERRQLGLDKNQSSAPTGPTDDQRKWAKSFRDSQPRTPQKSSTPSSGGGSFLGAAARNFRTAVGMPSSPVAAPEKPLNFSRSALVEGAKKSGDFVKTQNDFNKQSAAAQTGERMDRNGGITTLDKKTAGADGLTPYAREKFGAAVEDKAAQKNFARGEAPVQFNRAPEGAFAGQESLRSQTSRPVVSATKANPYGTATATFGPRAPGAGGTMTDPLTGKTVPMKGYLAQQSAVQDTKTGTSGVGEDRTSNDSGDGYFDPKKIREGVRQRGRVA